MSKSNHALGSFLILGSLVLQSCGTRHSDTETVAPGDSPQDVFRAAFAQELSSRMDGEQIRRTLPYLPPQLTEGTIAIDPSDPMRRIRERFAGVRMDDLYRESLRRPIGTPKAAAAEPLTVVFFPCILCEFTASRPLGDVLRRPGSFGQTWQPRIARMKTTSFDLHALRRVEHGLGEVVRVASIDDAKGRQLVRLIAMEPRPGSLETIGRIEDNIHDMLPRVDAVMRALRAGGEPSSRIVFMGFSRGAPLALEALTQARAKAYPWAADIKGLVSISGVLYGAVLADVTLPHVQTPLAQTYLAIRRLGEELQVGTSPSVVWNNTQAWSRAIRRMTAQTARGLRELPSGLVREIPGRPPSFPNPIDFLKYLEEKYGSLLDLHRPVGRYAENTERLKVLIERLIASSDELTTASRLQWWRTHRVPTDVHYYSLRALQADPWRDGERPPLSLAFPFYGPHSTDALLMRDFFYEGFRTGGAQLADGAVTLEQSRFWPELTASLNPGQGVIAASDLGIVATHHVAVAVQGALDTNPIHPNQFPRAALVRAIAASVEQLSRH